MTHRAFKQWWRLFIQRWDKANQPELAAFYRAELYHMDDETFGRAARLALRSCVYFPTVVELEDLAGQRQLTGAEAWGMVQPHLKGGTGLPKLPDAVARTVGAMGGFHAIGASEKDLPFRRKEFMELYAEFAEADRRRNLPALTEQGQKLISEALGNNY